MAGIIWRWGWIVVLVSERIDCRPKLWAGCFAGLFEFPRLPLIAPVFRAERLCPVEVSLTFPGSPQPVQFQPEPKVRRCEQALAMSRIQRWPQIVIRSDVSASRAVFDPIA